MHSTYHEHYIIVFLLCIHRSFVYIVYFSINLHDIEYTFINKFMYHKIAPRIIIADLDMITTVRLYLIDMYGTK